MKKIISILMAICMLVLLCACAAEPAADNSKFGINVCISSEPESIDPCFAATIGAQTYTMHMFEGLVKYDLTTEATNDGGNMNNTKLVYGQIEDLIISGDQLTYTFKLRDDIYWSDGEPVTAEDFVYAWQRVVDPNTAAAYGYLLNGIVVNATEIQNSEKPAAELGVAAIDEKTFEVTLVSPCSYFLDICAYSCLSPMRQDIIEANQNWTDPEVIVVNGAYKPVEWNHDLYLLMEPNTHYYDAANLGPDSIKWWMSDSDTSAVAAYQTEEYQFIGQMPVDMIEPLVASGDCHMAPTLSTNYLYFNCDKITDWRVRAALTLAIDRENIAKNISLGSEAGATGWISAGITDSTGKYYSDGSTGIGTMFEPLQQLYPDFQLDTYAGCCELAKALLAEAVAAGAWGASQPVAYSYNSSDTNKAVAEACAADWQTVLGLNVVLENQEPSTYVSYLGESSFEVARLRWSANYNDPMSHLEVFTSDGPYNFGNYVSAEYDALVAAAKTMPIGTERDEQVYAAEKVMFGEGGFPVCPILFGSAVYCADQNLSNIGYIVMGTYLFSYSQNNAE